MAQCSRKECSRHEEHSPELCITSVSAKKLTAASTLLYSAHLGSRWSSFHFCQGKQSPTTKLEVFLPLKQT